MKQVTVQNRADTRAFGRDEASRWDYLDDVEFRSQVRSRAERGHSVGARGIR